MSTKTYLLAAALLFGGALPAAADPGQIEYVRGHRALEIHEFMPQSGAVGSLVTIRGQGLRQVEYVLVGGYKVTPEHASGQELTFRVPRQHGDGAITLFTGDGSTVRVGQFTVFAMLGIDGFAPESGRAGSVVEIRGRGFQHGDQVSMNGRALAIQQLTDDRITVRIPAGASTDYLTVSRQGGVSERSSQRFRVLQAEPVITSLSPQAGTPGTEVRISGYNFGAGCKVFYGQETLPVLRHGHGSLDVRIPEYAQRDEYLYVNCSDEQGRSPYRFQLESYVEAPALSDMQPRQGRPGSRVVLYGRKLGKVDGVFLRGVSLPIVQRRGQALEVEIPYGVHSGAISLQIRGQLQQTPFQFQVLSAPQIHGFAPATVRPGQELTIHGRDFDADASVLIGGYQAEIIARSSNELRVYVPTMDGGDETVRVLSSGADITAAQRVHVRRGAEIAYVSPGQVQAGEIIVIRGQGFDDATRVFWGQYELRVVRRTGKRLEVLAPSNLYGTEYVSIDDGFGQRQTLQAVEIIARGPQYRRHGHMNG